jgi:hypothetical protein
MKRITLRLAEVGAVVSWITLLYGLFREGQSWPDVSIVAAFGLLAFGLLMALSSGERA